MLRILLAQINPIIGDLTGNTIRIINAIQRGQSQKMDLVVFPELALCGYPPEDFILLPDFMAMVEQKLSEIVQATTAIAVILGLPRMNPQRFEKPVFNSAVFIQNQKIIDFADKMLLPTYDVFDERRYFEPGQFVKTWMLNGSKIGITICEDLWQHSGLLRATSYRYDPIAELKDQQLNCLINISASPYSLDKFNDRLNVCLKAAQTLQCPVCLCNQVGGNDSLIFDGYSLYVKPEGLIQIAKGFTEDDLSIDLAQNLPMIEVKCDPIEDLYHALVLGLRDYFKKIGFQKACLGLSGGIDSAVVACIAAEALQAENVYAVSMPSRYSSVESNRDAALLAKHLGIHYQTISIEGPFENYLNLLQPIFQSKSVDFTEENLQARIRGMILMALSNKMGYLVLSTGNKSELALGYSTLYGDMCGSLSVIGDISKQHVYALANWINRKQEIIPIHTIQRPPSAELRPNQKDSDSLPDYSIVDQVVHSYVEEHHSPQWIAEHFNYPLEVIQDLVKRIHHNEYKRRQAPPVLRVSEKAFSIGRRFPIVQKWV